MINITENAKEKIISILKDENQTTLRFGLKGGGCHGFEYYLVIETSTKAEDDTAYSLGENFVILVDSVSLMYVDDTEIDYKKDIMGENFIFNNSKSTGRCGCGSSISF